MRRRDSLKWASVAFSVSGLAVSILASLIGLWNPEWGYDYFDLLSRKRAVMGSLILTSTGLCAIAAALGVIANESRWGAQVLALFKKRGLPGRASL